MKEISPYQGANIIGPEGGATTIACDNMGDDSYSLVAVDHKGAVVQTNGDQKIDLDGVLVLDGRNIAIRPGERKAYLLGSAPVIIEGTDEWGVRLNGNSSLFKGDKYIYGLWAKRYPMPR